MNNKKGFTLVELIVVIAIIGILAAVMIPQISGYITKAHRGRDVELAGHMTTEVSLYAADNGISMDDLTGSDIRTILLFSNYDLVPRKDKWVFAYDRESNQIVVVDVDKNGNIMFADTSSVSNNSTQLNTLMLLDNSKLSYDPIDPTHINQNYFLISKGKSKIEKSISILLNLREVETGDTNDDFEAAKSFVKETVYEKIIEIFDPVTTLYLNNSDFYTRIDLANEEDKITKIVILEMTSHLPNVDKSVADKLELNPNYKVSNTIRTASGFSELRYLFQNVKDLDYDKILKINIQPFGSDFDNTSNKKYIYKIDFKNDKLKQNAINESSKQVIKDEIIGVFGENSSNEIIIKRKVTVELYGKNGLFAFGTMTYAVYQK